MEKFLKRIRLIAVLMITLLIIGISFLGVYSSDKGVWENVLPKYNLGMELAGYRELHFSLDSSEETKEVYIDENGNYKGTVSTQATTESEIPEGYKIEERTITKNDAGKINIDNFEKTKKIIQRRLESYDLYEYNIRQDSVTGKIVLEVPDDENVDLNISLVSTIGELTFQDAQNGLVLLDDSNLVSTTPFSRVNDEGLYEVYLQIDYDEEGAKLLQEITKKYVEVADASGNTVEKKVQVTLDSQPIISTYFNSEITTGTVHIPMGNPTADYDEYSELINDVQEIANIINEENLPLYYTITDDIKIQSTITNDIKVIISIAFTVLVVAISIYMIIKFKFEGLRQAIFSIGYIAVLSLMFRYIKVAITINSLIAFCMVIVVNYIFSIKFLKKFKQEENRKIALKMALKELYITIAPIAIIAVIFTFMPTIVINSIGTTLFWGLLLQLLFSLITLV